MSAKGVWANDDKDIMLARAVAHRAWVERVVFMPSRSVRKFGLSNAGHQGPIASS